MLITLDLICVFLHFFISFEFEIFDQSKFVQFYHILFLNNINLGMLFNYQCLVYVHYILTGLYNADNDRLVILILKPTSINVCGTDVLQNHLQRLKQDIFVDGKHDEINSNRFQ